MLAQSTDDPNPVELDGVRAAAFAVTVRRHEDADTVLADAASDLRAAGVSWSQLATALGVVINSAKERFGCRPRPFECERLRRRVALYDGPARPRVTVFGRDIVADLHEDAVGRTLWRTVRVCSTLPEAVELAAYLDEHGAARYVKRPKDGPDSDAGDVIGWAVP